METKQLSGITLKRASLILFAIITNPGKYLLEVASNVSENNLFTDENGNERYIVNFKAVAADKLGQLKAAFEGKEEVAIESLNGIFLTGSIWKRKDKTSTLPMKGEKVESTVDFVENQEQQQVLRVTNIRVATAVAAERIKIDSFFAAPTPVVEIEKANTLEHA